MEVGASFAAGVVVLAGLVVLFARRREAKEARSVAGYRQALDVLSHLGGPARQLPARAQPGPPPRARLEDAGGDRVPLFADDPGGGGDGWGHPARRPALGSREEHGVGGGASRAARRARREMRRTRRALAAMGHSSHRLAVTVVVGVLALAAAAGAAYTVVHGHRGRTDSPRPPATSTRASPPRSVAKATAPRSYAPLTSSPTGATYAPVSTGYSLTVDATTAACWVSVTSGGKTLLEQTFAAGASASVSVSGVSTVVLGAPQHASVSVGGVPVDVPKGLAGPYTLTFSPR